MRKKTKWIELESGAVVEKKYEPIIRKIKVSDTGKSVRVKLI